MISAPADDQISSIFIAQFKQICKMFISFYGRYWKISLLESPELFAIVKPKKIRVIPIKFTIECIFVVYTIIIIGKVRLTTACRLNQSPDLIICASPQPGFGCFITILHHLPFFRRAIPVNGQRDVKYHKRKNILRYQINNFLWICIIPGINMDNPHRLFI
ncbi:hypothetical protein D3C75_740440 [compost metagenome]